MRLAFARRWLPALVCYSDELPPGMGGMTLAFCVVLRPKYRDDRGLLEHQLEHVAQWYAVLGTVLLLAFTAYAQGQPGVTAGLALASSGMHGFLYRRSRRFRLLCETQAFARQVLFPDRHGKCLSPDEAATRLCSGRYELGLDWRDAVSRIRGEAKAGGTATRD